jgi:hypothetical protein
MAVGDAFHVSRMIDQNPDLFFWIIEVIIGKKANFREVPVLPLDASTASSSIPYFPHYLPCPAVFLLSRAQADFKFMLWQS